TKPITVVTQFITDDGTANGNLVEIKRHYVQNGKKIDNAPINWAGIDPVNSITDKTCNQAKTLFGDPNDHSKKGGLKAMGDAIKRGMVLVMSFWADHAAQCLWLDSNYPTTKDASLPGVSRGSCPITSGVPAEVQNQYPGSTVKYGNIRVGDIGTTSGPAAPATSAPTSAPTTTKATPAPTGGSTPVTASPATSAPSSGGVPAYGQCGGANYKGPTTCVSGYKCNAYSEWYSQCIPN
ncbi:hypothetical protein AeRB84_006134, partial [Aphanomyces euteiches]